MIISHICALGMWDGSVTTHTYLHCQDSTAFYDQSESKSHIFMYDKTRSYTVKTYQWISAWDDIYTVCLANFVSSVILVLVYKSDREMNWGTVYTLSSSCT